MAKFKLESTKSESYSGDTRRTGVQSAIIEVKQENYIPPGVSLRSKISSTMFTGMVPAELIPALDKDPLIASYSLNRTLNQID